MKSFIRIGMIGLDSSRSIAFAKLLSDTDSSDLPCIVRITKACAWPSRNNMLDAERARRHGEQLEREYGVSLCNTPEEVAEACDVLLLLSADAEDRYQCFQHVVGSGKPIYVEKFLAPTSDQAQSMLDKAQGVGGRIFSASSVRFSPGWCQLRSSNTASESSTSIEIIGPMPPHDTLPPPLWYGVHLVDLAVDFYGPAWRSLDRTVSEDTEQTTIHWQDDRVAGLRGYSRSQVSFEAKVQKPGEALSIDLGYDSKVCNERLLLAILDFAMDPHRDEHDAQRMLEVVRIVEAMTNTCVSIPEGKT